MRELTSRKSSGKIKKNNRAGYRDLYLIMAIPLLFMIVFKYIPMIGIVMAFQDFNIFDGFFQSKFVGLENFQRFFSNRDFIQVIWNTVFINVYKLIFWIPLPIILAILINEIPVGKLKKTIQTTVYLPHFLSWVIVGGIFSTVLAVNGGLVNGIINSFGGKSIKFMYDNNYFRHVIVASSMWKEVGFGSVVYLGAITSIDTQMYEAAKMDGASKFKQVLHITLPSITGTIVVVLIMALGNLLNNSFEQTLIMINPSVYKSADVINTYVYRYGIGQMEFSYAAAVGVFNGLVGLMLVLSANAFSKKFLGKSLW